MSALGNLQSMRSDLDQFLGEDPFATDIYGVSIPYTPPEVAELIWEDMADGYWASIRREIGDSTIAAIAAGKSISVSALKTRILRMDELESIDAENDHLATYEMSVSLLRAYTAMHGATEEGPHGGPVLTAEGCAAFWDNLDRYAQYEPVAASTPSRWEAFKRALNDSTEAVGDALGRAAAVAGHAAGVGLGAGAGGFLDELGVVGSVIVLGAGVVAFKVLF